MHAGSRWVNANPRSGWSAADSRLAAVSWRFTTRRAAQAGKAFPLSDIGASRAWIVDQSDSIAGLGPQIARAGFEEVQDGTP